MKVILTGSTGFIGGEVLSQAINHPSITSIVCLTRRELPEFSMGNPKVKVIFLKDFATPYPPEVLSQLKGAEACIWSLGKPPRPGSNVEECKKIGITATQVAAASFASELVPALEGTGKTLRFVYLSGKFANRETANKLWFLRDARTIKGEAENVLLATAKDFSGFQVSIVRPGGVLGKGSPMPEFFINLCLSLKVNELAAVMIDEAIGAGEGSKTFENDILRSRGKELLGRASQP